MKAGCEAVFSSAAMVGATDDVAHGGGVLADSDTVFGDRKDDEPVGLFLAWAAGRAPVFRGCWLESFRPRGFAASL